MMAVNTDFKTIFDQSPNAYLILTPDLRIVDANIAFLQGTASRIEDIVGKDAFEVFPHDPFDPGNASATQTRASFLRVLETGLPDQVSVIH